MLYYYNIFLLLVQEISCYCCVLNNQSTQEKLFVSSVRWHFFVFRNSGEKLCVSWALSLVECVAVWALKLPVPHTDVLKPTSHKVFLRNYWKPKEPATNNRHKIIISNSVLYQIIRCIKKQLLITIHMCVKLSLVLPYSVGGSPSSQEY